MAGVYLSDLVTLAMCNRPRQGFLARLPVSQDALSRKSRTRGPVTAFDTAAEGEACALLVPRKSGGIGAPPSRRIVDGLRPL
jgi:hypothetical protein